MMMRMATQTNEGREATLRGSSQSAPMFLRERSNITPVSKLKRQP